MNQSFPFGIPPEFDPSKMDPKVLVQLSQLIQQLPPEQLNQMQTLMHNAMAGIDVRQEMEAFEKNLPPGFREKLMALMASQTSAIVAPPEVPAPSANPEPVSRDMDLRQARLTILQAVADGRLAPEEALISLFNK